MTTYNATMDTQRVALVVVLCNPTGLFASSITVALSKGGLVLKSFFFCYVPNVGTRLWVPVYNGYHLTNFSSSSKLDVKSVSLVSSFETLLGERKNFLSPNVK
jgi:hypothetical protein